MGTLNTTALTDYIHDNAKRRRLRFTNAERLILFNLAHRANDRTKVCNPSYKTIAADTCLNRRTVRRSIEHLKEMGVLIAVTERARQSNFFWINIPGIDPVPRLRRLFYAARDSQLADNWNSDQTGKRRMEREVKYRLTEAKGERRATLTLLRVEEEMKALRAKNRRLKQRIAKLKKEGVGGARTHREEDAAVRPHPHEGVPAPTGVGVSAPTQQNSEQNQKKRREVSLASLAPAAQEESLAKKEWEKSLGLREADDESESKPEEPSPDPEESKQSLSPVKFLDGSIFREQGRRKTYSVLQAIRDDLESKSSQKASSLDLGKETNV